MKPDFYKDEKLAECAPLVRILFQGLWCLSDGKGRQEYRPKYIKIEVLPYDDCDIETMLLELHQKNFIKIYEIQGKKYIQVINFEKHQRITGKEYEEGSKLPMFQTEFGGGETTGKQQGNNGETIGKQWGNSQCPGKERKGRERKGKEGKGKDCSGVFDPEAAPPVLIFPISGKSPNKAKEWYLTKEKITEYETSFPGVDILKECKKARQWCIDNATRRKTYNGMASFLTRWLSKCQDRGNGAGCAKTANRINPGDSGYQITDVDRVIAGFRNAKGIPKTDKEWIKVQWNLQKNSAQNLLDYFCGDYQKAIECINYTAEKCEGLTWGWAAVMNRAHEIKMRGEQ